MYVDVILKCPQDRPWIAMVRVLPTGESISLGYLPPDTLRHVAEILRAEHAKVEEHGHPSALEVGAMEDFVHWADCVAGLPEVER